MEGQRVGLQAPHAIALMIVAALSVVLSWFSIGLATTVLDISPGGPACAYDVSGGSGPVLTDGQEEIRWGLVPSKVCVGSSGGVRIVDDSHADGVKLAALPIGLGVGIMVWWIGRRWLAGKRSRSQRR